MLEEVVAPGKGAQAGGVAVGPGEGDAGVTEDGVLPGESGDGEPGGEKGVAGGGGPERGAGCRRAGEGG